MKKIILSSIFFLISSSIALAQDNSGDETYSSSTKEVKSFQVTPSILLLGIPHPMDGALEFVFSESFSIRLQKSFEPTFKMDGDEAKIDNKSVGIRKYFNNGPMFLGLAYGNHEAHVRANEEYNGFNTNIFADVKADYLTPTVGWKWVYDSGFTIGVELGWVFPFNSSSDVGSDQDLNPIVAADPDYQNARDDAEDAAKKFVDTGIPNIALLEIGWTF